MLLSILGLSIFYIRGGGGWEVSNFLTVSDGVVVVDLNFLTLSDEGGVVVFNVLMLSDGGGVVVFNFLTLAD